MIPTKTTTRELIDARNSHILCHPKYDDGKLHDDENVITSGDISMLATPIECGKRALITDKFVAAAISNDNTVIIDPDGNMYPDIAKCINEFLNDADSNVKIDAYKWSIGNMYAVGPEKIAIHSNGIPVGDSKASRALTKRESNSKLVKFYVDNVMDSVYNIHGKKDMTIQAMFMAPHDQHSKDRVNFSISFEGDNRQRTLESLMFHLDIVSSMVMQDGIKKSGIRYDRSAIKQSTAKRLLSTYVSSKMGVPYVPMKLSELAKEVTG